MKISLLTCLVLLLACATWQVNSLKILGLFHMTARSHYILGSRLMVELANRGHEVTVISPFGEKNPPKNYRDVVLTGFVEEAAAQNHNLFDMDSYSIIAKLLFMNFMTASFTEKTLAHENVQKLLKSNEKFDVVVLEQFGNDAHRGLCHKFDAACVILSTIGANTWVNNIVGNPAPLSYVPSIYLAMSGKMTFYQRIENALVTFLGYVYNLVYVSRRQQSILNQYLPDAPSLDDLNNNISLILLNSHVSTSQPVPHLPNMIEIGGYHLSPPKALPKDLQDYLDNAKEGVVYFSLGSNVKSKDLPIEKREEILRTFSKLKQKVLWKWEDDVLPGQPANVKLGKWLPQQSILAHPNIKVFITHGGLLSTTETIYHGKPIIAIPIFGDQKMNAKRAESNGFGLIVHYKELTEEKLSWAINEIVSNKKYAENAKVRSKLMHDRPLKPIDSAVYWIEYAARHKGEKHYRSASLDLYWYQYYLVDVLAFIAANICALLLVGTVILKKVCGNKKDKKQTDKKKKSKLS